jgi:hypothetical protein
MNFNVMILAGRDRSKRKCLKLRILLKHHQTTIVHIRAFSRALKIQRLSRIRDFHIKKRLNSVFKIYVIKVPPQLFCI